MKTTLRAVLVFYLALAAVPRAPTQIMTVDATAQAAAPETGYLHLGGTSPIGHALGVNSRYLTLDGKPIYPVMGEFHFSRFPPQYWEAEILKMKAAGIDTIATYIFWIHHEEIEGQFDWTGQRDLRRFVELCAKHHMRVFLRVGPWAHGEARNGGFPDWLMKLPHLRTNDPAYLQRVTTLFTQIDHQVQGLLWKDGGPIIGLQLENEYPHTGPGAGSEHILRLKQIARAAGLDTPLYSVTGWPTLDFPPHEVVPVSGGYPDGFWYGSLRDLPPSPTYLFNPNRELGDMGATISAKDPSGRVDLNHDPYLAAEQGGGMAIAYHRRPLIAADDIAALTLTGLGSGINLYGYYMFHGGANPTGKLSTLQESQATGYPNDLPTFNYDFQAPLGEYGQTRDTYRKIKTLHLFLNAFGPELAPMAAHPALPKPASAEDAAVPRVAVRSQGQRGFIFVNNYVRQLAMPTCHNFQLRVQLPQGEALIPAAPIDIPSKTYFIWPMNLDMAGATLRYSTAQLVTEVETPGRSTFVFFAVPGIAPEFRFQPGALQAGGDALFHSLKPGKDHPLDLTTIGGRHLRILLLTQTEAESLYVLSSPTGNILALTPATLIQDEAAGKLTLTSTDPGALHLSTLPALPGRQASTSLWSEYTFTPAPVHIPTTWTQTRQPGKTPPMALGPYVDWRKGSVATTPPETAFANAAEWTLITPAALPPGVSDLWLKIHYTGDIAQLRLDGKVVDDQFFYGPAWEIGLKRYLPATTFKIDILPLRANSPIYLDASVVLPASGQTATLSSIEVLPEYQVSIPTTPANALKPY